MVINLVHHGLDLQFLIAGAVDSQREVLDELLSVCLSKELVFEVIALFLSGLSHLFQNDVADGVGVFNDLKRESIERKIS